MRCRVLQMIGHMDGNSFLFLHSNTWTDHFLTDSGLHLNIHSLQGEDESMVCREKRKEIHYLNNNQDPSLKTHTHTLLYEWPLFPWKKSLWIELINASRHTNESTLLIKHSQCTIVSFERTVWRRQWHPTPVLPGESRGQGSLVGCRLWGRTESDTTEAT